MAMSTVTVLDATSVSRAMEAYQNGSSNFQQTVREVRATTGAVSTSWTVTAAGLTNVLAADQSRVDLVIISWANARLFVNYSATIPTTTVYNFYLDPGERYEVPFVKSALAVSLAGQADGGFVLLAPSTAA